MNNIYKSLSLIICLILLTGCQINHNPHTHEYIDGKCSCGKIETVSDPDVHTHEYVDGICSCGKIETEIDSVVHTHEYVDGQCVCGKLEEVVEPKPEEPVPAELEFTLSSDNKYYIVTEIDCSNGNVINIPEKYNNLPVKQINGKLLLNANIYSLNIPKSVTNIYIMIDTNRYKILKFNYYGTINDWCQISIGSDSGSNILSICLQFLILNQNNELEELNDIIIPNGITKIKSGIFSDCPNIRSVTIPISVNEIGFNALSDMDVESIYYSGTIKDWCNVKLTSTMMRDNSNFYLKNEAGDYYLLEDIVIPKSITKIGDYQFAHMKQIKSVTFNENITSIGTSAFVHCTKLKEVDLPNSLKSLGNSVFIGCETLEIIRVKSQLETTGYSPFPSKYTSILIDLDRVPEGWYGVEASSNMYFKSDYNKIINVNNTKYLVSDASLKAVLVKYEAKYSNFEYDHTIKSSVTYEGVTYQVDTISAFAYEKHYEINTLTIEEGITTIYEQAFSHCEGLRKVSMPNSIQYIGMRLFEGCGLSLYTREVYYEEEPLTPGGSKRTAEVLYVGNEENPHLIAIAIYQMHNLNFTSKVTVTLHEDTKFIGPLLFQYNRNVEKVIVPKGVEIISEDAFLHEKFEVVYSE